MDFNYAELIKGAAALGKPILLSAGMSNLEECRRGSKLVL
jgi:sialic acid synthase SpsE